MRFWSWGKLSEIKFFELKTSRNDVVSRHYPHPDMSLPSLGNNNVVLNPARVNIVEATSKSKRLISAFVYVLLLHALSH